MVDATQSPDRPPAPSGTRGPWHALPAGEVADELGTGPEGLATSEVEPRRDRHGPNRLEEIPPPGVLEVLVHQFMSPLIYILLVATVVTLLLRDWVDAGVIAAVLVLNAAIGFVQERRAEASVRGLMQLVAPHARVIRDGREHDVAGWELVPGDLVLLEPGVRVSADLRLAGATALSIDESLLTGESMPVRKHPRPVGEKVSLADRTCMAFSGSIVASGRGRGYVVATMALHAGNSRSEHRSVFALNPLSNRFLFVGVLAALGIHAAALYLPFMRFVLRVEPLELSTWPWMLALALPVIAAMEFHKLIRRRR